MLTPRLLLSVALLLVVTLPESGFAQSVILRSALLSGGGQSSGPSVAIRAGFGEAFGSMPGAGTNVLRTGIWLQEISRATAVDNVPPVFAGQTSLGQNYPNPFNPRTSIPFSIAQADLHVRLKIYSVAGPLPAGPQEVVWDGTDTHQHPVASGVYVYLLETPDFRAHSKLVLVR